MFWILLNFDQIFGKYSVLLFTLKENGQFILGIFTTNRVKTLENVMPFLGGVPIFFEIAQCKSCTTEKCTRLLATINTRMSKKHGFILQHPILGAILNWPWGKNLGVFGLVTDEYRNCSTTKIRVHCQMKAQKIPRLKRGRFTTRRHQIMRLFLDYRNIQGGRKVKTTAKQNKPAIHITAENGDLTATVCTSLLPRLRISGTYTNAFQYEQKTPLLFQNQVLRTIFFFFGDSFMKCHVLDMCKFS